MIAEEAEFGANLPTIFGVLGGLGGQRKPLISRIITCREFQRGSSLSLPFFTNVRAAAAAFEESEAGVRLAV
ncbi:hypothetical protein RB213_008693 [Colletotrichum asianum]